MWNKYCFLYIYSIERVTRSSVRVSYSMQANRDASERRQDLKWRNSELTASVSGQYENEVADARLCDLLDGHMRTASIEAVTSPHEECGITLDARRVWCFEGSRDMPPQGTEARCRFDTNCKQVRNQK